MTGGMAGLDKRKEERLIKAVKDLSKLPPNKRCADCTEKLPQYVNLTFSTFICTGTCFWVWFNGSLGCGWARWLRAHVRSVDALIVYACSLGNRRALILFCLRVCAQE
jgi:hypothetical protein